MLAGALAFDEGAGSDGSGGFSKSDGASVCTPLESRGSQCTQTPSIMLAHQVIVFCVTSTVHFTKLHHLTSDWRPNHSDRESVEQTLLLTQAGEAEHVDVQNALTLSQDAPQSTMLVSELLMPHLGLENRQWSLMALILADPKMFAEWFQHLP